MDPTSARAFRAPLTLLLSAFAALALPLGSASALSITFAKVADTGTSIPGGSGTFTSFGRNPSIAAGEVAFRGDGDPTPTPIDPAQQGVYSTFGGLHAVADGGTSIPGGAGSFETFTFKPSIEGGAVAWNGDGAAGQEGIYQDTGSGALLVADRNTLLPGGQTGELFDSFVFAPVLFGGVVAFHAEGDGGVVGPATSGLYWNEGGSLSSLVDNGTTMPGTAESFAFLSNPSLGSGCFGGGGGGGCLEPPTAVFRGTSGTGFQGVYRAGGSGALSAVADETTLAPSGNAFQSFAGDPVISAGSVVFRGTDTAGLAGIFLDDGITLTTVADENTPIPEGGGSTFNLFGNYAIDHDIVVFEGIGTPGSEIGLYAQIAGALHKIIDLGDTLDGKTITELEISREAISGFDVAFWARFSDNSEGIFLTTIPEPGTAVLLALGLSLLGARRRRTRPRRFECQSLADRARGGSR